MANLAREGTHRLGDGEKGIAHEDGGGVGIVEDIDHFLGGEPVVHRRGHRPDGANGGGSDHAVQRVVLVDDHVIAAPDAERAQREGEAVAPVQLLRPGEPVLTLDEGNRLRILGRVARDKIH